jgi:hypothetical protein
MNKILLSIAFLFLVNASHLFGQENAMSNWPREDQLLFENANQLLEEKIYSLANQRFSSLLEKHPNDMYLKYQTAISGIYVSDKHKEAEKYLTDVANRNKKAANLDYYFALLYHKNYQFDKSIELCNTLLKNLKTKPDQSKILKQTIQFCNNGKDLVAKPLNVKINSIGNPPNTNAAEYSPVISADEETIYYTYRGEKSMGGLRDLYNKPNKLGFYFEDIYFSQFANGQWQSPQPLDNANTISNDAVIAVSNDGQSLFIFRATDVDGGDIYECKLEGETFSEPKKLLGQINSESWEGSVSLSGTQRTIVFSSERPGGKGGKDLYSATRMPDGSWGKVKNLGSKINTTNDEDAPFLHPDGRTLVFSSQGHNSMGGYDIFTSDLDEIDSTWKAPENIGYPVNTTDDDIYYVLSADGKRGYYASAKEGGQGDKDIYVVEPAVASKKSILTVVKGRITENMKPYGSDIAVYLEDGRPYGVFKSNSATGNYLFSVPSGFNYRVSYYHFVLGERLFDIKTNKVDGYAEKLINVNFGDADTIPKIKLVEVEPKDSLKISLSNTTGVAASITPSTTLVNANSGNPVADRAKMLEAYGNSKVSGLNYVIQVGAYRKPGKFNKQKLAALGNVLSKGNVLGDIELLVLDKSFSTWQEAEGYLKKVKNAGQKDAFITAYYNGKRYYISELLKQGVLENRMAM